MSEPYTGRFAGLYDEMYAGKPYGDEARFVAGLIERHVPEARTLLEIACGTGEHAFAFERLGYHVTATDVSEDMIRRARVKAGERSSGVTFEVADMRTLSLGGDPFDAVVCLFDSIGYVRTGDGVDATLANVHDHLAEGGLFVAEFWHAPAMRNGFDPVRIRRFRAGGREVMRVAETSLSGHCATVRYTLVERMADGTAAVSEESHTNRFFDVDEMVRHLESASLKPVSWHAGCTDGPVDDDTWHVIVAAQR